MGKKISLIQKLAWLYALGFLFVVTISHWPGLTDEAGMLLGLFAIDPIDDIFHLVSGLAAAVVALHSYKWSTVYFKIIGIPYIIDAITSLFFSREFLNLDVFTQGLGGPNFSLSNIAINFPHVVIALAAFWISFSLAKKEKSK